MRQHINDNIYFKLYKPKAKGVLYWNCLLYLSLYYFAATAQKNANR